MNDLAEQVNQLNTELDGALEAIGYGSKIEELERLTTQSQLPDFWSNSEQAQAHMQKLSKLQFQLAPWQELKKNVHEIHELIAMNDESIRADLEQQYTSAQAKFGEIKKQLQFSGPYDDHDALLSIYAGAGGTDAQDWAGMMLRMYTRWAEQNNMKVSVLNESAGEEAGLKSVELEISGSFAFAKLKSEHGVHRLVRQSPFNADAKRQTSFAKVEVLPKIDEPDAVPIDETELKIDVFRAGGHGGQSVNTTDSAVRITHLPTNIVVSIQNERSQLQNKETAMTILRSKLAQLKLEQHAEKISELKGPNEQAAWGNQIRSYVLHPYKMVKDLRTNHETSDTDGVLDGNLNPFIDAYLENSLSSNA
jgi:peptide chain release factor 2